jgi:hypothetical protein
MSAFHVLNARSLLVEELLRFDTGRRHQREMVRQAILDSNQNVYIYGSRGSGKTFFQKTQAYYFKLADKDVLPLFVPCDIRSASAPSDSNEFALNVLSTLFLEWWQRAYERPKSDLLRLGMTGKHSVLDDLRPDQQQFVQLYSILHASLVEVEQRRSSLLGAAAVAKAETRWDEAQSVSRGAILPSEVSAIVSELATIMADAKLRRVIVHLDEVELIAANRGTDFYSVCLELFNPAGVQFVVTGTPFFGDEHELLLSTFEITLALEGLDTVDELESMISKYSEDISHGFERTAIEVLFEFFEGHPRLSLLCCANADSAAGKEKSVTPRIMTKTCLAAQKRVEQAQRAFKEITSRAT